MTISIRVPEVQRERSAWFAESRRLFIVGQGDRGADGGKIQEYLNVRSDTADHLGPGFTPTEVADKADVDRAGRSRFMAGKPGLTLVTADKIAAAFHLRRIEDDPPSSRARRPSG